MAVVLVDIGGGVTEDVVGFVVLVVGYVVGQAKHG